MDGRGGAVASIQIFGIKRRFTVDRGYGLRDWVYMPLSKEQMREYMRKRRAGVSGAQQRDRGEEPTSQTDEPKEREWVANPPCPKGYDAKMWEYACERAVRARRYALKMPEHVRPSEVRFQDAQWQYEDQGRYPLPVTTTRR